MGQIITIGLDIAKQVFQVYGSDASGNVIVRKKIARTRVLSFFAAQPPCVVALEACGGAHYWGREIGKLGHSVKLIAPSYVKPFVKRQKNDAADAEAICEAALRPTMRFVSVKSEAAQASALVFRTRDLLVRQRTQLFNALRGHLTEYGVVVAKGPAHIHKLVSYVTDSNCALPEQARTILLMQIETMKGLEQQIVCVDKEISLRTKEDKIAQRLMTIPGIGPINAVAITALAPPLETFNKGRDFAAWVGLTPLQKSSGGKQKLGAISKMGDKTIRRLLILGASSVVHQAVKRGVPPQLWLARMLARKPRMLVIVALANKMARIVWALLKKGENYKAPVYATA